MVSGRALVVSLVAKLGWALVVGTLLSLVVSLVAKLVWAPVVGTLLSLVGSVFR